VHSPLFLDLLHVSDPETHRLVEQLLRACKAPLADCPLLPEAPPAKVEPAAPPRVAALPALRSAQGPSFDFAEEEEHHRPRRRQHQQSRRPLVAGVLGAAAALGLLIGGLVWALNREPGAPVAEVKSDGGSKSQKKSPARPGPDGNKRDRPPERSSVPDGKEIPSDPPETKPGTKGDPGSSGSISPPPPETPSGPVEERVYWQHGGGYFAKAGGSQWIEKSSGWLFFKAARRTAEYVQLFDESRQCSVRLYADRCEVRGPWNRFQFQKFYDGGWKSKPANLPEPSLPQKPAAPPDESLAAAEREVREAFKADYSKTRLADKRALAAKLLERGLDGKEKPAACFVLLREACDQAGRGLDVELAMRAAEELDRRFQVNARRLKTAALERAEKLAGRPAAGQLVAEAALEVAESSLAADDQEESARALRIAQNASQTALDPVLQNLTRSLKTRLEALGKEQAAILEAEKVLADKPDDPAANLVVGKYHALTRGDQDRGLPYLAKGADATLRALAIKDQADPPGAAEQAALGDEWWNQAGTASGEVKSGLQRRALYWYRLALTGKLAPTTTSRVEGRIKELEKTPGVRGRWDHLDLDDCLDKVSFVRIDPRTGGALLSTRASYTGPVEITVVARTEARNLQLNGPRGSSVLFNGKANPRELRLQRPDAKEKRGSGSVVTVAVRPLAAKTWYTLRWRITEKVMEVTVNGAPVFQEIRPYNLTTRQRIEVEASDSMIDVRAFSVRGLR
jgi:hypothetical protein